MGKVTKFLSFITLVVLNSNAEIAVGDTFVISAGYGNSIGMSGGSTEATNVLDSIVINGDTTFYHLNVKSVSSGGFFESGGVMPNLISRGQKTQLTILSSKPSCIQNNSNRFEGLKWILSEKSSLLFYSSIEPISPLAPIPMDLSSEPFTENDFYTVRYTDTSGMKWVMDENDKSCLQGHLIFYENRQDLTGVTQNDSLDLPACDGKPRWYSLGNVLRFYRFETSSLSYPLVGDQMAMGDGCYSTRLIYYKPINPVSIRNKKSTGIISPKINSSMRKKTYSIDGKSINARNVKSNEIYITIYENGFTQKHIKIRNEKPHSSNILP